MGDTLSFEIVDSTENLTTTESDTQDRMSEDTDDGVHFVEDLEERSNASPIVTTMAIGEEEPITMACTETGC